MPQNQVNLLNSCQVVATGVLITQKGDDCFKLKIVYSKELRMFNYRITCGSNNNNFLDLSVLN